MDIIISAPEGVNKMDKAQLLLTTYLGAKSFYDCAQQVMNVSATEVGDNISRLAQRLREGKPGAMLFHIDTPTEMLTAVGAVKNYRETTGRPNVMAVYIERGGAVVLTDKYNPKGVEATEARKKRVAAWPVNPADRFDAAARPLMDYLANEHHPHYTALVTSVCAELVEGHKSCIRPVENTFVDGETKPARTLRILYELYDKLSPAQEIAVRFKLDHYNALNFDALDPDQSIDMHAYLLDLLRNEA